MTQLAPTPQRGSDDPVAPALPGPSTRASTATTSCTRRWLEGWWAATGMILSLLTAVLAIVVVALAVAGLFSVLAAGAGVLLFIPGVWGAWALGRVHHKMLIVFAGTDIGPPLPSRAPTWRRAIGLDGPRLRSLAWASLHGLWGMLAGIIVLVVLTQGIALMLVPLLSMAAPEEGVRVAYFLTISGTLGNTLAFIVGLVAVLAVPTMSQGLANVDIALARWLLGDDPQRQLREMSQRVETLTTSREETIDSVEAERRRIERDLHDGPQQRLVSIAMNLGLARSTLDTDPEGARALIDEAHASSKEAIVEMRQVARGIVPPILTDRGLDAAVSAIAARSPVPVSVTARLPEQRPAPSVEAIAYFCVSEALTNAVKHSGATSVSVDLGTALAPDGEKLAITVRDNGRGGAVIGNGTGLTGLRQRVASVDGEFHVHSPVDGGTTVSITLPMRPGRTR